MIGYGQWLFLPEFDQNSAVMSGHSYTLPSLSETSPRAPKARRTHGPHGQHGERIDGIGRAAETDQRRRRRVGGGSVQRRAEGARQKGENLRQAGRWLYLESRGKERDQRDAITIENGRRNSGTIEIHTK